MLLQQILDKNPQLNAQWQQVVEEVQDNQRLRIGFWAVLGIVLFYIGILIGDGRDSLEKQIVQAKQREIKAINLADETFWLDRANQAQSTLSQLQLKFNSASTAGVAKATLQGLINDIVSLSTLGGVRIRIEDGENITSELPLWTFVVSIDADFDPLKAENLLFKLSQHPYHLSIDNLEILPGINRIRLRVRYWFAETTKLEQIKQLSQQLAPAKKTDKKLDESALEAIEKGVPSELFN